MQAINIIRYCFFLKRLERKFLAMTDQSVFVNKAEQVSE